MIKVIEISCDFALAQQFLTQGRNRFVLDLVESGRRDSDPRPSPWQGDALPAAPLPHGMTSLMVIELSYEPLTGFEPVTCRLQGGRSDQLSYRGNGGTTRGS